MTKKRFALATGLLSALGLAAYLGHRHQVTSQQREEAILAEVRAFFAQQGPIEVVYVTWVNSRADRASGGVVFADGTVFEFRYVKGQIDYRQLEEGEEEPHA